MGEESGKPRHPPEGRSGTKFLKQEICQNPCLRILVREGQAHSEKTIDLLKPTSWTCPLRGPCHTLLPQDHHVARDFDRGTGRDSPSRGATPPSRLPFTIGPEASRSGTAPARPGAASTSAVRTRSHWRSLASPKKRRLSRDRSPAVPRPRRLSTMPGRAGIDHERHLASR